MRTKLLVVIAAVAVAALSLPRVFAGATGAPGLNYTGDRSAPTGTDVTLSATLNDASSNPVAGSVVAFTLANQPTVTATTDSAGAAAVTVQVVKAAGSYLLDVAADNGEDTTVRFAVTPPATEVSDATVAKGGGEPSIAVGPEGNLYVSSPAKPMIARSTDDGATWSTSIKQPFSSSGDTSVGTDSTGAVYVTNLTSGGTGPFQDRVFKSTNQGDGPWVEGSGPISGGDASNQPFQVDRQWEDAYVAPGKTTDQGDVYITYHDWAPNQIWVNASHDGGKTFGAPIDVIQSPLASADSFCDTIPGGLKVVQSGPHAGRIYVAWLAGDPVGNVATGCNVTELQTFHTVWVAWSDDQGQTWTDQLVYDGGTGKDAGSIFADVTLDDQGNPYVAFAMNIANEWDVWVEASFDNGVTWNGASDGSGAPYKVNADTGSHYFPAIAAGDPGKVAVVYLRTPALTPTIPTGKGAGGTCDPTGQVCDSKPFPPNATWKVYVAQSLDLRLGSPTWTITDVKAQPMHQGDICNLGIFCGIVPGAPGDRSLLDFIDIAVDANGFFHAAYCDNYQHGTELHVANQTAGPSTIGS